MSPPIDWVQSGPITDIMIIVKLSAVEQCLLVCPPIEEEESCPMTVIYQ